MRCTFFKEACDKFYHDLHEGQVYFFSGGRLKIANKKFSNLNAEYEVTFDTNSEIKSAGDDDEIKLAKFEFVKISELQNRQDGEMVDVIGIVNRAGECTHLTSKAGKELDKREIYLVDDSNNEISLTLWADKALDTTTQWENMIVALKGAKVSDFGGKTLGCQFSTVVMKNPDIPEAGALRNWYDTGGSDQKSASLSKMGGGGGMGSFLDRSTFADIKEKGLGMGAKPDYITVKGTITFIKRDQEVGPWYNSVPEGDIKYKVIQEPNGEWRCEKLDKVFQTKTNRYILPTTASDWSGNSWLTAFDECAVEILGTNADELEQLKMQDEASFEQVFT